MMINRKNIVLVTILLSVFTGCSEKKVEVKVEHKPEKLSNSAQIEKHFVKQSAKHNINPITLKAICKHESGLNPYKINVNKNKTSEDLKMIGGYDFKIKEEAQLFMNVVFSKPNLSYDVGYCQINNQHFSKNNLESEDLLDIETNIGMAAKIYKYGVNKCSKEGINNVEECSLSVYNTGRLSVDSTTGRNYANKVLKIKNSL